MAKLLYVVTCPICGSRDEYTRPDPPEHTCGHRSAVAQLLAVADALGKVATRWQQSVLDAFARADRSFTVQQLGRASGRATAQRLAIAAALALGGHVHVAAHDGLWCVRPTALGALWEQLPRPAQQVRVTYDEIGDWADG
jgi:hypothetical protein